jgi:hypothetical protein
MPSATTIPSTMIALKYRPWWASRMALMKGPARGFMTAQ